MGVGLSWISLDSLVRIEAFQWVMQREAGKLFSQPFSLALRGATTSECGLGHAEAPDSSWAKLTLFSDFLQEIAGFYSVSC
jgi:hypothetical protein